MSDAPKFSPRLWIAQGFGAGRAPVAPGTFGSLVGLGWFALLAATGSLGILLAGSVAGLAVSVWICGAGERLLGQKDPGSIVLDEIAALPVCFFAWVALHLRAHGTMPAPGSFFSGSNLIFTIGVFAAFRFFDVVKPWPVRQSQRLPGGWGVTVDDLLAAVYVNVVTLGVSLIWHP